MHSRWCACLVVVVAGEQNWLSRGWLASLLLLSILLTCQCAAHILCFMGQFKCIRVGHNQPCLWTAAVTDAAVGFPVRHSLTVSLFMTTKNLTTKRIYQKWRSTDRPSHHWPVHPVDPSAFVAMAQCASIIVDLIRTVKFNDKRMVGRSVTGQSYAICSLLYSDGLSVDTVACTNSIC